MADRGSTQSCGLASVWYLSQNEETKKVLGAGPRLCIGQRLAYIEEKLALVYILRQFSMEKGPKTEVYCLFQKLNNFQTTLKLSGSATVQPEAVTVYLKSR